MLNMCDCRCNNVLYFSRDILIVMVYWNHYLVLLWWHYEDDKIYFSNCIIQNYSALLWISLIDCLITAVFINIVLWPRLGGGEAPSCRLPGLEETRVCRLCPVVYIYIDRDLAVYKYICAWRRRSLVERSEKYFGRLLLLLNYCIAS